jgi:hypothetical protein
MRERPKCEKFREKDSQFASPDGADYGAFCVPFKAVFLHIISSGHDLESGWEHVSVSLDDRCPTWPEMCFVKNLFWPPEESVVQFHPPASKGINVHEFCLHMWRPIGKELFFPPLTCV